MPQDIDGSCRCTECGSRVDDEDYCFECEQCLACCSCDPEVSRIKCRNCKSDIYASQKCEVDGCGGCELCCSHASARDAETSVCEYCENVVDHADVCGMCGKCRSCCGCGQ